jgi:hypothetical protein
MKRFLSIKTLVLTATLLLGSIAVVATERAFSGHGSGVLAPITDGNGNVIAGDVTGSGNATHLGSFTNEGRVIFTPDPDNPNIVHPSGQGSFTAANGDKLTFDIQNASMDLTTGLATGDFHFTGGTGRFANASGVAAAVVQQNFITGGYELTLVGKIDF